MKYRKSEAEHYARERLRADLPAIGIVDRARAASDPEELRQAV